jgi:mono/diheme cytochrome c family protein
MKPTIRFSKRLFIVLICLLSLLYTACGGGSSSSSSSSPTASSASASGAAQAVPTMPAGNFKPAAENQITKTVSVTGTQTSATAPDLALGKRVYTKNKCADCHGEKGEIVAGKTTKAIGGTSLTAEQFDQFLRTGGGLGNDHIFGPSAISPGGMQALYAYVKPLPGK